MPSYDFSKILLCAVDESLSSLGNSSKQAILFHLESTFNVKAEDIPTNLTQFSKALEGIFGLGASYLEKLIVKHLHEKLNLRFEEPQFLDFSQNVEDMKRQLMSTGA